MEKLLVPRGLSYREYQEEGIHWMLKRKACILGDDMGIGKTIQAIGVANQLAVGSILVICPASIKINWKKEMDKWLTVPSVTDVVYGNRSSEDPDNLVLNYAIVGKNSKTLRNRVWDLVIVDEAHNLKNRDTKRVQELFGKKGVKCKRIILMTGTPMRSRPSELFTLLKIVGCKEIPQDYMGYTEKFCSGFWDNSGYKPVWNDKGSSNRRELSGILQNYMLRRMKRDVMADLPPVTQQLIYVYKKEAFLKYAGIESAIEMRRPDKAVVNRIAEYRKIIGLCKVESVSKHILSLSKKTIIFCHHRDVVKIYKKKMEKAGRIVYTITGDTPAADRYGIVQDFNDESDKAVLIGNEEAMGEGLNIQGCNFGVFAELPWTPALLNQCICRMHRDGQKYPVTIHIAVQDESIDSFMANIILRKKNLIRDILDWVPLITNYIKEENRECKKNSFKM